MRVLIILLTIQVWAQQTQVDLNQILSVHTSSYHSSCFDTISNLAKQSEYETYEQLFRPQTHQNFYDNPGDSNYQQVLDQYMSYLNQYSPAQSMRQALNYSCRLENTFGDRLDQRSVSRAYSHGDVPARFIHTAHLRSKNAYVNLSESLQEFAINNERSINPLPILDLIRQSIVAWDNLVESKNGSPDDARNAYRRGRVSRQVKQELTFLHSQVINYLDSLPFGAYHLQNMNRVLLRNFFVCDDDQESCLNEDSNRFFSFRDLFHPLIGQVLFEILTADEEFSHIFGSGFDYQEMTTRSLRAENAALIFEILAPTHCFAFGLWPAAMRPVIRSSVIFSSFLDNHLDACGGRNIRSSGNIYSNYHGIGSRIENRRGAARAFIQYPRNLLRKYQ